MLYFKYAVEGLHKQLVSEGKLMIVAQNKFNATSEFKPDMATSGKTMLMLTLSQWNTFDLTAPAVTLDARGTGMDCIVWVEKLEDLEAIRDMLITACEEHKVPVKATEIA